MSLLEILPRLRSWLSHLDIPAQVQTDTPERLWVIFETENALGELIVSEPDWAPYRHVSFRVLDLRLDAGASPVFCFCDDENSTVEDILRALERGIRCLT